MKLLLYIIFVLSFIGCVNNQKQIGENIKDSDTIKSKNQTSNESTIIELNQIDYQILPIDESGNDVSLIEFITNLKKIVSNKDTSELFESLDSEIVVSEGGGIYGIKEFSENWKLYKPNQSKLWGVLSRLLKMGGTWENDEDKSFCIPYAQSNKAFKKFNHNFDWYFTAVCISPKVPVYKTPKSTSLKLAYLNYNIVEFNQESSNLSFTKINTIDKKIQGYVSTKELIFTAEPCLILRKIGNNWRVTSFAPFD